MRTLLFVRSYGDFIVALYALQSAATGTPTQLLVSRHLWPLYQALPVKALPPHCELRFIDLGIRHNILAFFTNKFLLSTACIKELRQLHSLLKELPAKDPVYFERYPRLFGLQLLMGKRLTPLQEKGVNMYDSYTRFFAAQPVAEIKWPECKASPRLLVIPDSRKKNKTLPDALVQQLQQLDTGSVTTAFFKKMPGRVQSGQVIVYHDFEHLVQLIGEADMVISPDSLAAHLAQLLSKPHWIFYNKRVNTEWLTPFSKAHHCYGMFSNFAGLQALLNHTYESIPDRIAT